MSLDLGGFLEETARWVGINFALDKLLPWIEANGVLALVLALLVTFPVTAFFVHKSEKIPVKIPFMSGINGIKMALLLAIYLVLSVVVAAIFVKEAVTGAPAIVEHGDRQVPVKRSRLPANTPTFDQQFER